MPDLLRQVRGALLVSLILLLVAASARAEDSYILALTWQPGFCAERAGALECKIAAKDKPRLVLHGLWPDWDMNGDSRRDASDDFCVSGENNRKVIIRLDSGSWLMLPPVGLSAVSGAVLAEAMPGTIVGLDRHEWWKHGSCSGLKPEEYFATSIALQSAVERGFLARLLANKAGATLKRKVLVDAFENDFGRGSARALMLDCANDNGVTSLMEIRIRLKRETIAQGLSADSLAIPAKAPRGDCGADIRIRNWPE